MPKPPNEYRNAFEGVDVDAGIAELIEYLRVSQKDSTHSAERLQERNHRLSAHCTENAAKYARWLMAIESLSKDAERYDFVKACCTVEYEGESIEDDAHLDRLRGDR